MSLSAPVSLIELFSPASVVVFILVATRLSGLLLTAPLLSSSQWPVPLKSGFLLCVTLLVWGSVGLPWLGSHHNAVLATSLPQMAPLILQELLVGLSLGYVAYLLMVAVQISGEILATQMGLAVANTLDPTFGGSSPVVGQLYGNFAMVTFFGLNLHHWLLKAVVHTYSLFPLAGKYTPAMAGILTERLVVLTAEGFALGLLIAMPLLTILLLLELALGFMAKLVPQMNIFVVGLPLKVIVGLGGMAMSLPHFEAFLGTQLKPWVAHLWQLWRF